jgi:hypothetical protein
MPGAAYRREKLSGFCLLLTSLSTYLQPLAHCSGNETCVSQSPTPPIGVAWDIDISLQRETFPRPCSLSLRYSADDARDLLVGAYTAFARVVCRVLMRQSAGCDGDVLCGLKTTHASGCDGESTCHPEKLKSETRGLAHCHFDILSQG